MAHALHIGPDLRFVVHNMVKEDMEKRLKIEADAQSIEYTDNVTGAMAVNSDVHAQTAFDLLMNEYLRYFSASRLCLNQDKCAIMVIRSS